MMNIKSIRMRKVINPGLKIIDNFKKINENISYF